MGKKIKRKIIIDGTEYLWTITFKHAKKLDDDYVYIGIWCEEPRGQKLNVKVRFDDPWFTFGTKMTTIMTENGLERIPRETEERPITPGDIRQIVTEAIKNGWSPKEGESEVFLKWERDEKNLYQ